MRIGNYTVSDEVTNSLRKSSIGLLSKLTTIKGYKVETLFLATNLLDRYLANVKKDERVLCLGSLTVCCLLIATKAEEPKTPSYGNMCRLLEKNKVVTISKKSLYAIEREVLI